jgi:starch phosphorylase
MDKTRQMEVFASAPLDKSVTTFQWDAGLYEADTVAGLKRDIIRHIVSSLGLDYARRGEYN